MKKTILVTGAANGLGRDLTSLAAAAGHHVFGLDRVEPSAPQDGVRFVQCDLRSAREIRTAIGSVVAAHGHIDVLINNAVMGSVTPLEYVEEDWIADSMMVNLVAPLVLTREVLPGMRERGSGRIVNISSISSLTNVPGTAVYAASKAGLERGSKILRAELDQSGVSIGVVKLGRMRTDSFRRVSGVLRDHLEAGTFGGYERIEDVLWAVLGQTDVGMNPRDVAAKVLEFTWTERSEVTIAPLDERIQVSLTTQLPPLALNGLLRMVGRRYGSPKKLLARMGS